MGPKDKDNGKTYERDGKTYPNERGEHWAEEQVREQTEEEDRAEVLRDGK